MNKNNPRSINGSTSNKEQDPYPCVLEFCQMIHKAGLRTVCDLGCGSGRHAVPMAKLGLNVIALDISQETLNDLNEVSKKESLCIETLRCNLPRIPLTEGSVDAVVSTNVIHHAYLETIKETISEIYRILSPGGYVIVTVFSKNDYRFRTGKMLEKDTYFNTEGPEKNTIHYFFSKESLLDVFSNFQIITVPKEIASLISYKNSENKIFIGTLLMGVFRKKS